MVPPHPAPDLVMSQASFALGPFQRRFDPGPMGPTPQPIRSVRPQAAHCSERNRSGDVPRRSAPRPTALPADPSFMLGLDPDAHRLDFQRPSLAVAPRPADPAEGTCPCSPCIGTNEGDLTFPTDAGFPGGSASLQITDLGIARTCPGGTHWPHARRFARNSADRPNSSSPTTQRWGNRGPLRFKRSEAICRFFLKDDRRGDVALDALGVLGPFPRRIE